MCYRLWGRAHSSTSMHHPPSAHCQTKRPTSGPSAPPKSGLPVWSNKSPAVTLPVPSLPRVPCIKAGFRRQTHQGSVIPPIQAHKNTPLNLGRVHTLPFPVRSSTHRPSTSFKTWLVHPTSFSVPRTLSFRPICLPQNLSSRRPLPINLTRWTTKSRAVFAPLLFDQEPWARLGLHTHSPERSLLHNNTFITH